MDNRNYYHDYLAHHGVKGMKWGVRRYQNADGSLTPAGKKRIRTNQSKPKVEIDTDKCIKIGSSVCAGILASGFGAKAVFGITGSTTVATMLAPTIGVMAGMSYYDWINS